MPNRETSAERLIEHSTLMRKDYPGIAGFVVAGDSKTNADEPKSAREQTLRFLERGGFSNPINDSGD